MPVDNKLHKAAHNGDLETIKKCIEGSVEDDIDPIDVDDPGAANRRALHRSAGAGHLDITIFLIEKGAKIDNPDNNGRTALHLAAISGESDIVRFLLSKGANILAVTSTNMNSLQLACEGGRVETVKALMESLTDNEATRNELSNNKNADGKTAWDIAAGSKNSPLCTTLKEMGDVNAQSATCSIQ